MPYDGISALNIPSNSLGAEKVGTAGDIFLGLLIRKAVYTTAIIPKSKIPVLQVEEDWWQKIDPKTIKKGGTIAEKFTQTGQIEDCCTKILPPNEDKYTYGELADLSDDFYTGSIENKQALNLRLNVNKAY